MIEYSPCGKKAMELFKNGCNCSQSVFTAFAESFSIDEKLALSLSSGFGGGIGRLRRTCGAISGGVMALGYAFGYDDISDYNKKSKLYALIQDFVGEFERELGSSVCAKLLNTNDNDSQPEMRSKEYYEKRPCCHIVGVSASIVENMIKNKLSD